MAIPLPIPEGDGGKLGAGPSGLYVPFSSAKSFSCFRFISSSPSSCLTQNKICKIIDDYVKDGGPGVV